MTYLQAHADGTLQERIDAAVQILSNCNLCPRRCGVNRCAGERGVCTIGRYAEVASYGPHFGEESCLVGRGGSGTIFFCGCNLMCSFCQNFSLSRGVDEDCCEVSPEQLAQVMIELQNSGCHNINFVTPTHVTPQILESLPFAIELGLKIPLVYNCGGYEEVATLHLLDSIIDIYMPDAKFYYPTQAENLLNAPDYTEKMKLALLEMQRQVGDLVINEHGFAERGLLVRHLLMPSGLEDAEAICRFLAEEISTDCYLNLMDQYRPCGEVVKDPGMRQSISPELYQQAIVSAAKYGLTRIEEKDLGALLARLLSR